MSNGPEATTANVQTVQAQGTINVFGDAGYEPIGQIPAGKEFQVDPSDTLSLFGDNDGLKVTHGDLVGWASRSEIYPDGEQVQAPEVEQVNFVEP